MSKPEIYVTGDGYALQDPDTGKFFHVPPVPPPDSIVLDPATTFYIDYDGAILSEQPQILSSGSWTASGGGGWLNYTASGVNGDFAGFSAGVFFDGRSTTVYYYCGTASTSVSVVQYAY